MSYYIEIFVVYPWDYGIVHITFVWLKVCHYKRLMALRFSLSLLPIYLSIQQTLTKYQRCPRPFANVDVLLRDGGINPAENAGSLAVWPSLCCFMVSPQLIPQPYVKGIIIISILQRSPRTHGYFVCLRNRPTHPLSHCFQILKSRDTPLGNLPYSIFVTPHSKVASSLSGPQR